MSDPEQRIMREKSRPRNELGRVLALVVEFRHAGTNRRRFARRHRLHPSALSRILRVEQLPPEVLSELASLPSLSRTHIEVLATAPPERRGQLLDAVRSGRSTYRLRDRRETTAVETSAVETAAAPVAPVVEATPPAPPAAPAAASTPSDPRLAEVARALGATEEETRAFANELLLILWRSGRDRVEGSFAGFRGNRSALTRST
jgi:ParB-like chromosome segregation protein Spo0J